MSDLPLLVRGVQQFPAHFLPAVQIFEDPNIRSCRKCKRKAKVFHAREFRHPSSCAKFDLCASCLYQAMSAWCEEGLETLGEELAWIEAENTDDD